MSKNILALDLGTTTGWATSIDGKLHWGHWSLKGGRYEGGGMRYLRFRSQLVQTYKFLGRIDVVYFEEVRRHLGTDAAHIYGGLLATLTAWCEEQHIAYQGIPVGTIKKHATGKGNANKMQMIIAAVDRGWNTNDDNEADALWLLDCAIRGEGIEAHE